jgi:hypothetical protein
MSFLEYLIGVDARTALMGRMMQKMGVDRQLKVVADHAAVTSVPLTGAGLAAIRTNVPSG